MDMRKHTEEKYPSPAEEKRKKRKIFIWTGIIVLIIVIIWILMLPTQLAHGKKSGSTFWSSVKTETSSTLNFIERGVGSILKDWNLIGNEIKATNTNQENINARIEELEKEVFPQFEE